MKFLFNFLIQNKYAVSLSHIVGDRRPFYSSGWQKQKLVR